MEKATKAIRRSGTKLKGLSGRHGSLQVLISQLGDLRTSCKGFISSQQTAADDMVRWSNDNDNRAIQDACAYLSELSFLWTEVQKDFSERLREFRTQFELILEGDRHVDQSRELYSLREQREIKCRKELSKTTTKGTEEVKLMEERVVQAEKGKELAYMEVVDRIKENEAVKLIRFREGLRKLSSSYVALGEKCQTIFTAYNAIATTLPDVHDKDLTEVRYTGSRESALIVQRVKEQILLHGSMSGPASSMGSNGGSGEQFVNLPPDEKPPQVPPKKGTKQSETLDKHVEASGNTDNAGANINSSRYDPPPSYSSVVQEDEQSSRGACGYTPSSADQTTSSNPESTSQGGRGLGATQSRRLYPSAHGEDIQISYPRHLNSFRSNGAPNEAPSRSGASAPVGRDGPIGSRGPEDGDNPYQGLHRSISDRRPLSDMRDIRHPVLRRHESTSSSSSSSRPYSSFDYPQLYHNQTQMTSIRLEKQNSKKLSLKSLSLAGNAISGFLGLNVSANNNRDSSARQNYDSDTYETYDFSNSQSVSKSSVASNVSADQKARPKSVDYTSIHGVLPEELNRVTVEDNSDSSAKASPSTTNSQRDASVTRCNNEKARALAAKFALSKSGCREELCPPQTESSTSRQVSSSKTDSEKLTDSDEVLSDVNKKKNEDKSINVKSRNQLEKDLIDLSSNTEGDNDNDVMQNNLNKCKTINNDDNNRISNNIIDESRTESNNSSSNLDGDLKSLAKPRKNTNPFYDCSDDSEDNNSAAFNR